MHILSWNIQAGLGCDGKFDTARIIDVITKEGSADVICLQEVARNFPEYGDVDQVAILQDAFPEHEVVWGAAMSGRHAGNRRQEFGNLTLVRRSYLHDSRIHRLPFPVLQNIPQMPRVLVETFVQFGEESLCLLNTHLAFHSQAERSKQVAYISDLTNEMLDRFHAHPAEGIAGAYIPFARPEHILLCGDLNLEPQSEEYQLLQNKGGMLDAWCALYGSQKHEVTCGIYDHQQWPQGAHCRDFFFITSQLRPNLQAMDVNIETDASDHQPISLFLER